MRSYRIEAEAMYLTTCVERTIVPPYGLHGGGAGTPFRIVLTRDGVDQELSGKANLVLRRGDIVTLEGCGGGGFGRAPS